MMKNYTDQELKKKLHEYKDNYEEAKIYWIEIYRRRKENFNKLSKEDQYKFLQERKLKELIMREKGIFNNYKNGTIEELECKKDLKLSLVEEINFYMDRFLNYNIDRFYNKVRSNQIKENDVIIYKIDITETNPIKVLFNKLEIPYIKEFLDEIKNVKKYNKKIILYEFLEKYFYDV